ncbi:hypothetical protein NQ317_018782, partial [Molorchus minor]
KSPYLTQQKKKKSTHNTIGIWDAKLTYLDIPVPKIAGKMDVPFRISRDILKAIKFVVIIELIKLMSRSVNQVYTKNFKGLWLIICNFAKNFSWDGLKGKKAFRNLNLETVIRVNEKDSAVLIPKKLPGIKYCMLIASSRSLSPFEAHGSSENNTAATKDHPTPTQANVQDITVSNLALCTGRCWDSLFLLVAQTAGAEEEGRAPKEENTQPT